MGTFNARVGVSDGNGGATHWVTAAVDTGATFTVLPETVLRDVVGIEPDDHSTFTYADGREALLPVGVANLCIDGKVLPNRVVFGDEGLYLLGATSLQVFGLIADTTHHRLIPAPKLTI